MLFNTGILPIFIAGIMNGAFIVPTRYVENFTTEKIWFCHSIIGLAILPWLFLIFLHTNSWHNYALLNSNALIFLLISGCFFGMGQVCFAYAIEFIGIARSFAINLGTGVITGSMFVILYNKTFFSMAGYLVTFAVVLIVAGLMLNYFSHKDTLQNNYHYRLGWSLAILTGITSGLQNIAFIMLAFYNPTIAHSEDSFWVWPPFLLIAAIPMALGFWHKMQNKQKNFAIKKTSNYKNIVLICIMGLLFTGSLSLYSSGMSVLSLKDKAIGWPVFMVSIILMSQGIGWYYREFKYNNLAAILSLLLLLSAIIILGCIN